MNATLTPYEALGGEAGVRRLVKRFYEIMDELPEAYGIRKLHPEDLSGSEEKLFMYMSGYLGGPQLFVEKFGHPMLRARHLPFAIAERERDQWLWCMERAIADDPMPDELKEFLRGKLRPLADHMRNR